MHFTHTPSSQTPAHSSRNSIFSGRILCWMLQQPSDVCRSYGPVQGQPNSSFPGAGWNCHVFSSVLEKISLKSLEWKGIERLLCAATETAAVKLPRNLLLRFLRHLCKSHHRRPGCWAALPWAHQVGLQGQGHVQTVPGLGNRPKCSSWWKQLIQSWKWRIWDTTASLQNKPPQKLSSVLWGAAPQGDSEHQTAPANTL